MASTPGVSAYPSRLDTWTDCPRRYRFDYVERPRPPRRGAWAHQVVGAAAHVALAGWWRLDSDQRTPDRVADLVDPAWSDEGFADHEQSVVWLGRARAMVARYVETETRRRVVLEPHGLVEPRRVEASVALRASERVSLMGRPDRVDERPGSDGTELVVVDYKTSRREPSEDDARTSRTLAIYAAAAESTLRRPATRVELHHLPTGRVVVWRHDRPSRDRHVARAAQVALDAKGAEAAAAQGAAADDVFPPRPSKLCAWCDYYDSCPEGAALGPAAESWAGLWNG